MAQEEARSTVALAVGVLLPALATVFFNGIPGAIGGSNLPRWGVRLPVLLACAAQLWFTMVSRVVPEPYLDEVFHIPQAQRYCRGKFSEWDNKITTPPGLYLISVMVQRAASALRIPQLGVCDEFSLRAINFAGIMCVSYLALWCRQAIEARQHEASSAGSPARVRAFSQYAVHTSINIGLFPPLFFFTGLYYTDVLSTAVVLAAFLNHLARVGRRRSSVASDLTTVLLGISALLMRQTNVFWVVVFMGGLETVHAVKTLQPGKTVGQPATGTLWAKWKHFALRCSTGDIHDLPIHVAYADDMVLTALSIVIAAISNPIVVIRQVWPYFAVFASFTGFVQWNGGVVLGDKSNHVATIHLPQMLYIWPFFTFFSLPLLLLPSSISFLNMLATAFSKPASTTVPVKSKKIETPSRSAAGLSGTTAATFCSKVLWLSYLAATVVVTLIIVEFNTIVHPFTLADNRHYMFYVFRYTIRCGRLVRGALVLPYTLCRWMVRDALGGHSSWSGAKQATATHINHPFRTPSLPGSKVQSSPHPHSPPGSSPGTSSALSRSDRKAREAELKAELEADGLFLSTRPVATSTGIVLLLATTLSLVTAPLVEPRYFIVPWVLWRLMVPAWRLRDHVSDGFAAGHRSVRAVADWSAGYDVRLFLESVWHVAINLVTGYVFLYKPFVWKAEDGTVLDGGRLQRFMW